MEVSSRFWTQWKKAHLLQWDTQEELSEMLMNKLWTLLQICLCACIRTREVRATALQIFVDVEMWRIMEWKYFSCIILILLKFKVTRNLNCMVELGSLKFDSEIPPVLQRNSWIKWPILSHLWYLQKRKSISDNYFFFHQSRRHCIGEKTQTDSSWMIGWNCSKNCHKLG